jgi:hypothetical protein
MLVWSVLETCVRFEFRENEQVIPVISWSEHTAGETYAQILLLQELLDNGRAEADDTSVLVPHEEICQLSSTDQQLLNLPPLYPFDIRVDADGTLNQPDFRFNRGFYEHPHGRQLFGERKGCILTLHDGAQYLLSAEQLALCKALDEFNGLPAAVRQFSNNLLHFTEIKELSTKSAAVLDTYLQNEHVIAPKAIRLQLRTHADDSLEILPEVEEIDTEQAEQFEQKFDRFPTTSDY